MKKQMGCIPRGRGRKIVLLLLVMLMALALPALAFAAAQTQEELETQALKSLGLFSGTDYGDQLHRQPTRMESAVMLIRLLGMEETAKAENNRHPFTDVPDWADAYAGYCYAHGLSAGVSETRFGTEEPSSLNQYLTFVLRALGYRDQAGTDGRTVDFSWGEAASFAASIGLWNEPDRSTLPKADGANGNVTTAFPRGDMVRISWNALSTALAGSQKTLAQSLIEKGVFTQEQYDGTKTLVAAGPKDVRAVYLTFDDGPNKKVTPRVLETLAQYDIKATFFVVGHQVDANPDMLLREYQEGHRIGNHSDSHVYKTLYASTSSLLAGIRNNDASIDAALGFDYKSNIFRFPGGSFGKAQSLKDAVTGAGYKYYDWNCSAQDAASPKGSTAAQILKSVKDTSKGKSEVIVLMHDAAPKGTTADALPDIIEYFMDQGYVFRTL